MILDGDILRIYLVSVNYPSVHRVLPVALIRQRRIIAARFIWYFSHREMDQRRHYDAGSEFTRTAATNYRGTSLLCARLHRRCTARRTIYSTPLNRRARPLEILPWRGSGYRDEGETTEGVRMYGSQNRWRGGGSASINCIVRSTKRGRNWGN